MIRYISHIENLVQAVTAGEKLQALSNYSATRLYNLYRIL